MRVVATAGHVDHGKSTLVRVLTGTDPDRFADEKARGLTIDLGFAFTTLASGATVGFVDVPGHVRFVKNMLAGVGSVEVALLVVAANEGWMPQTAEHVAILDLLGVAHGLVVVTKADTVDEETLVLAQLEVQEHLTSTALAQWPVVVVDSLSGRGLDELRATLDVTLATLPAPRDDHRPRLWVDRVFTGRGTGTVVTGTLTGGQLAVDQPVVVEPGGHTARVRRIESSHTELSIARPDSRVALNLAGIDHAQIHRGDAVVLPGQWLTPRTIDIAVRTLGDEPFPRRGEIHVHLGSGEFVAQLRPIDAAGAFARLEVPDGLPLAPGDRMILRSSARRETIGGGIVLDLSPAHRLRDARQRLRKSLGARVVDARPWATPSDLAVLAGAADADAFAQTLCDGGEAVRVGNWIVAPTTLAAARARAVAVVRQGKDAPAGVELATLASACGIGTAQLRAALAGEPAVVVERELVRDATAISLMDDPAARSLLDALEARPFDPPSPADLGATPALIRALVRDGVLVDLDGVVLARSAYDTARRAIARRVVERGTLTISDARELLRTSRKYIVPILTRLDAEGVTRRRGDERVPGPRVVDAQE